MVGEAFCFETPLHCCSHVARPESLVLSLLLFLLTIFQPLCTLVERCCNGEIMLKCGRGQEQSPRSGCWPQAKTNKQSEWTVSLELDGGKTAGERWGEMADMLISSYSVLPAMAFRAGWFFSLKNMSLSCMSIHLTCNLVSNINSDGL